MTNQAPSRQAIGVNERSLNFDHLVIESAEFCKTWFIEVVEFLLHFSPKTLKNVKLNKKNEFVVITSLTIDLKVLSEPPPQLIY